MNRGERNPYTQSMDKRISNDTSMESISLSIERANKMMRNENLNSISGPANSKKNIIVNKSKSKELANLIPKRSKFQVRSVLADWKHPFKRNSEESFGRKSPYKDYDVSRSQNHGTRISKIDLKNTPSLATSDHPDYYSQEKLHSQLLRQNSSEVYDPLSIFDSYLHRNPSSLDKYFKCDLGKKHLNKVSIKEHKREISLNDESRVELPKDPEVIEPLYSIFLLFYFI